MRGGSSHPRGRAHLALVDWRLHRDYLCKRWGGCTSTDEQRIDHHLGLIEANDAVSLDWLITHGHPSHALTLALCDLLAKLHPLYPPWRGLPQVHAFTGSLVGLVRSGHGVWEVSQGPAVVLTRLVSLLIPSACLAALLDNVSALPHFPSLCLSSDAILHATLDSPLGYRRRL